MMLKQMQGMVRVGTRFDKDKDVFQEVQSPSCALVTATAFDLTHTVGFHLRLCKVFKFVISCTVKSGSGARHRSW